MQNRTRLAETRPNTLHVQFPHYPHCLLQSNFQVFCMRDLMTVTSALVQRNWHCRNLLICQATHQWVPMWNCRVMTRGSNVCWSALNREGVANKSRDPVLSWIAGQVSDEQFLESGWASKSKDILRFERHSRCGGVQPTKDSGHARSYVLETWIDLWTVTQLLRLGYSGERWTPMQRLANWMTSALNGIVEVQSVQGLAIHESTRPEVLATWSCWWRSFVGKASKVGGSCTRIFITAGVRAPRLHKPWNPCLELQWRRQ